MTRQKAFLILQSALCILTAILLAAAAVMIFREGSAYKAAGHPAAWIYTREKAAAQLVPILPLFAVSVIMTVIGWIKGISDETIGKPVQDAELARNLMCAKIKAPSDEMKKERDLQKKLQVSGQAVFAACMIPIHNQRGTLRPGGCRGAGPGHPLPCPLCGPMDRCRTGCPLHRRNPAGKEHGARDESGGSMSEAGGKRRAGRYARSLARSFPSQPHRGGNCRTQRPHPAYPAGSVGHIDCSGNL